MIRNLFQPFVGLGTRLRTKAFQNPFFATRLRLTALFFVVGLVVSVGLSEITDAVYLRPAFLEVAGGGLTPAEAEEAYNEVQGHYVTSRFIRVFLIVVAAYFLAGIALRPVKRAAEFEHRFIGNISHELKTPLAVIKTRADVALRKGEDLTLDEARAVISKTSQDMTQLGGLVKFMSLFSDVANRHKTLTFETVSLRPFLLNVVSTFQEKAHSKNISLVCVGEEVSVAGNESALTQLMANVLENAITHTPREGRVQVACKKHPTGIEISVTDTGPGIQKEDTPLLFEPFFRGKHARSEGAGLGLSIVGEIARLHGARASLQNGEEGGAVFSLIFPLA